MTKFNYSRIELRVIDEAKKEKSRHDKLYNERLRDRKLANQKLNASFNVQKELGFKYLGPVPPSKEENQEWYECYYMICAYGEMRNYPDDIDDIDDSYNRFIYWVRICLIGSIIRDHKGSSKLFPKLIKKLRQAASKKNRYSLELLEYLDIQSEFIIERIRKKEKLIEDSLVNSFK